ncbi:MAG: Tol-Pal system beta propeller repeat protein TolB [Nitrospinota bacterium]
MASGSNLKKALLAAGFLASVTAPSFGAEVFIDIERKKGSLIRMAMPEFLMKEPENADPEMAALGREAKEILDFDIGFSGYFSSVENKEQQDNINRKEFESDTIEWDLWKELGTHALVKGEYSITPDNEIAIESRLFDVERREQIIGIRYTGSKSIFRKMVHRFADQIVYRFSGEAGIADTRIAFIARVKGHKELFLMDYDGENIQQITRHKSIILSPAWSPLGGKILFTTYKYGNPDLYSLDLITGEQQPVSNKRGLNTSAAWSPDGEKIALTLSMRGNSDIYLANADGTGLKRLTRSPSIETSPSFSPDGKRLAYVSNRSGTPQIYTMDVDGKDQRRLTFEGDYNADPAWSPKGDQIAYAGIIDGKFNIQVKNIEGRYEKQLTFFSDNNIEPEWSSDGRHIAFTSSRNGSKQIFLMNATGENQIQITNMRGGAIRPSWEQSK